MNKKCVAILDITTLREIDISSGEHLLLFPGGGYTLNGESLQEWVAGELEEFLDYLNHQGFIADSEMKDTRLDKYINKFKTAEYVLFFPGLSSEAVKRAEDWHKQNKKSKVTLQTSMAGSGTARGEDEI